MKASTEKFQFNILSRNVHRKYNWLIDSHVIVEFSEVELLGLIIDNKLTKSALQIYAKQSYTNSMDSVK